MPCELTGGVQTPATQAQGRLWFACDRGVVGVDPRHLDAALALRPPVVDRVLIDGRAAAGTGPIELTNREAGYDGLADGEYPFRVRSHGTAATGSMARRRCW